MITFIITSTLTIVPTILLLWYFYKRDLNPEPRGVLTKTFLLGIAITVPVIVLAMPIALAMPKDVSPVVVGLYTAFLCAAFPEELFKFWVVNRYSARNRAFNEPMDGVVYGATASLGFATLENSLYVMGGGWPLAILRALTAVPGHACLGAIMGYYVGQARFSGKPSSYKWLGLLVAIILHGLYNFPVLSLQTYFVAGGEPEDISGWLVGGVVFFLAVLIFEIAWVVRIVRRLRREQLSTS